MSILTKICVVLVLVVSVAASGAFLRIVSVQRSWKNAYLKQKDRADVADLTSANDKMALQKKVIQLDKVRGDCLDHNKALADEQVAHAADKAAAAQAAAVLQGHFDMLKASLTEFEKNLEASLAMKAQLRKEKAALVAALELSNEAARGLKKDFDGASVQITRLESMVKHYVVLIKDIQAEKAEMQLELDSRPPAATVAGKGVTGAPVPVTAAGQAVSGKITAVHEGVASINIGRAKGIKENMMLKVFRGGKFVSHLRIDLVQPDSAAGVILDKKLEVMQGDEVATDLK